MPVEKDDEFESWEEENKMKKSSKYWFTRDKMTNNYVYDYSQSLPEVGKVFIFWINFGE